MTQKSVMDNIPCTFVSVVAAKREIIIVEVVSCRWSRCSSTDIHARGLCVKHYQRASYVVENTGLFFIHHREMLECQDCGSHDIVLVARGECVVEHCNKEVLAKHLCSAHYNRARRELLKRKRSIEVIGP